MLDYLRRNFILFPSRLRPSMDTKLLGKRIILRKGLAEDWRQWRHLRALSRDFLVPWEPSWPPNALNHEFYLRMVRRQWREWQRGTGYTFLIFLRPSATAPSKSESRVERLLGGVSLNDVQLGSVMKGTLGYWIGEPYANHGYMTEAGNLVCNFAFTTLKLKRVEASCLPRNEASKKVLMNLGFVEEGFAKNYLRINGQWEDHLLWGKTQLNASREPS